MRLAHMEVVLLALPVVSFKVAKQVIVKGQHPTRFVFVHDAMEPTLMSQFPNVYQRCAPKNVELTDVWQEHVIR